MSGFILPSLVGPALLKYARKSLSLSVAPTVMLFLELARME